MAIIEWLKRIRRESDPIAFISSRAPGMSSMRRYGVREEETTTTDLHDAVALGELSTVSHLLILPGVDPCAPGQDGKSPLQTAIEYDHTEIVKLLLRMPTVSPHYVVDELHRTPLHIACWKGHGAIVELLLATRPKKESFHIPTGEEIDKGYGSEPDDVVSSNEAEHMDSRGVDLNSNFKAPIRARMSSITLIGQRLFGSNPAMDTVLEEVKISTPDLPTEPLPYVDVNAKAGERSEEPQLSQADVLSRAEWMAKGFTPLHLAAWKGSEDCVKLLLAEPGIDLGARTSEGFTPLHMAADRGHEEVIHLIVQEHANRKHERQIAFDVNLITERDMTYMNHERDQRMLKFQLSEAASKGNGPINAADSMGRTPLHYAARQGRVLTVKELLRWNDTYVNIPDACGMLPMHMAAREGHAEVVSLLLYEYHWGPTVLKTHKQVVTKPVTFRPFPEVSNAVLEVLPRPDLIDAFEVVTEGSTPLHLAAIRGQIQAVLKLLKYVDATVYNGKKQTALDVVLQQLLARKWIDSHRLIEMFKLLLVAMPKVAVMSDCDIRFVETLKLDRNSGRESLLWKLDAFHATTLLHWAAAKGSAYLVQLLICQPGVDINQVSSEIEKFTPLHMAAKAGHTGVIRLLVAEKEKLRANEEDWLGRTALQIAAERHFALKHGGRGSTRKLPVSYLKKNPLEGIIEISWRDCEHLLLGREDVQGYVDLLYRDRQVFVDAANAILVGSALIATVTYNGWMTPPLGYIPYYHIQWELPEPAPPSTFPQYAAIEYYPEVRAFWMFNCLSFFFSMASVIASAEGILPVQGKFIKEAVQDARRGVAYASSLLVISVVFALGSFAASGYAVLPPVTKWRNYMTTTLCFGALVTIGFTVRFIMPVSRMLKPQYSSQGGRRGKFQRFEWL